MNVHPSVGGLVGAGSPDPAIPERGPQHAKHRGRKHGKKRSPKRQLKRRGA